MIAILDALGAASYSQEYIEKFLESRKRVLALLRKKIEEMQDRIESQDIDVFTFNDTILIAYNTHGQQPTPRQIRTFFIILRRFFVESLSRNILFRGAIAIGTFYMDKKSNTVMGQAVTDAAAWYDKADWIGIHATPKATLMIRQWGDSEIKRFLMRDYDVPLKGGGVLQVMAVNWPHSFLVDPKRSSQRATQDFLKLFCEHHIPFGTEPKYYNTLDFFRAITKEKEESRE